VTIIGFNKIDESVKKDGFRVIFWPVLQHSLNPSVTLLNWVKILQCCVHTNAHTQSVNSRCVSQFPLRLNIACCVWWLRIAWLGSVAKTINFHSYGHHGIKFKGEARHTLSVAVREAVYHKFVLRNHHTQHAMFKRNMGGVWQAILKSFFREIFFCFLFILCILYMLSWSLWAKSINLEPCWCLCTSS